MSLFSIVKPNANLFICQLKVLLRAANLLNHSNISKVNSTVIIAIKSVRDQLWDCTVKRE